MKQKFYKFAIGASLLAMACGNNDVKQKPNAQHIAAPEEQGSVLPKETFAYVGQLGESAETKAFMDEISFLGEKAVAAQMSRGIVMAYITPEGISYRGFGDFADMAKPEEVVFEISGMTKVMTGMALASMVNEGKVSLDTPITACQPEGVELPAKYKEITLGDLVTHTSGLPAEMDGIDNDSDDFYTKVTSSELWKKLAKTKIKSHGKYQFSNYGFALLGAALANCDGEDNWETLVNKRVTKVLDLPSIKVNSQATAGYDVNLHAKAAWNWESIDAGALGAFKGNAKDLAKLVQMSISTENFYGHNMLSTSMKEIVEVPDDEYDYDGMAYGWSVVMFGTSEQIFIDGQSPIHSVGVVIDPDEQYGLVLLSNTRDELNVYRTSIANSLRLFDEPDNDIIEQYNSVCPAVCEAPADEVALVEGTYQDSGVFGDLMIRQDDQGELWYDLLLSGLVYFSGRLFPIAPYTWYDHSNFLRMEFIVSDGQKAESVIMKLLDDRQFTFTRKKEATEDGNSDSMTDLALDGNSDGRSDIG